MIIGLDFDNTIVDYHALFYRLAVQQRLIPSGFPANKTAIRDHLRATRGGDEAWQRLQGSAYGTHIGEALSAAGLLNFLRACQVAGEVVYIVSHKTHVADHDPSGTNLRTAAIDWMNSHGLFGGDTGLAPSHVFFEPTRQAKLSRIAALNCDVFVDDLPETLTDAAFPTATRRILFSAQHVDSCIPEITVVPSFAALSRLLLCEKDAAHTRTAVYSRLLGESVRLEERLGGGRNSKVYRLIAQDGTSRVAKFYFRHADDQRDRLKTEFDGLSMLWEAGIRQIPQSLMADTVSNCAIYAYIEGQNASTAPNSPELVDQAVDFVGQLHRVQSHLRATEIGFASEACFSISALVRNIRQRLEPFQLPRSSAPEADAVRSWVNDRLAPAVAQAEESARGLCASRGQSYEEELEPCRRTLSPSDFGFHNARLTDQGRLVFLDFEYFGWDDPAKLIADFLLHPAMLLSGGLRQRFTAGVLRTLRDDGFLRDRLAVVYPLYALKWCTILLNEFLPSHRARRDFARGDAPSTCFSTQLERATTMLQHALPTDPLDEL